MTTRRNGPEISWTRIEDFLRDRGADRVPHPGGTLLAHLGRVARTLAEWGADPAVQVAGLCHAAYGTDGFDTSLLGLDERATLAELIGERAEALVHFYACCDRSAVYPQLGRARPLVFRDRFSGDEYTPAGAELRALMEITAANELDLVQQNADLAARYGPDLARLFARSRDLLSTPAQAACARLLGPYTAGSSRDATEGAAADGAADDEPTADEPTADGREQPEDQPAFRVDGVDHLVLTVADVERSVAFYQRVLGMEPVTFGDGRRALAFGSSKINLHEAGRELLPHAARPTPGSADLCLVTPHPQREVTDHLAACGVAVEEGPVQRTGALGPFTSTYLRDPDGNLIEVSTYPRSTGT